MIPRRKQQEIESGSTGTNICGEDLGVQDAENWVATETLQEHDFTSSRQNRSRSTSPIGASRESPPKLRR